MKINIRYYGLASQIPFCVLALNSLLNTEPPQIKTEAAHRWLHKSRFMTERRREINKKLSREWKVGKEEFTSSLVYLYFSRAAISGIGVLAVPLDLLCCTCYFVVFLSQ